MHGTNRLKGCTDGNFVHGHPAQSWVDDIQDWCHVTCRVPRSKGQTSMEVFGSVCDVWPSILRMKYADKSNSYKVQPEQASFPVQFTHTTNS